MRKLPALTACLVFSGFVGLTGLSAGLVPASIAGTAMAATDDASPPPGDEGQRRRQCEHEKETPVS